MTTATDDLRARLAAAWAHVAYPARPDDVLTALLPVVESYGRACAATALAPFRDLFAGGPDTACRTTWHGGGDGAIECVEVPMDDLRDAFARAEAEATP